MARQDEEQTAFDISQISGQTCGRRSAVYPVLRSGRWLTLLLLGRERIAAEDSGLAARAEIFGCIFALFSIFHFFNHALCSSGSAVMPGSGDGAAHVPTPRGAPAVMPPGDAAGYVVRGDAVVQDTRNTFIHGRSRLVAAVGVKDLVIVDTPDAVLVAHRNAGQDVKAVVRQLERAGREEHRTHRRVHRPWGSYDSVHEGEGFKVKHITVRPGQRLSLQSHRRRAEHWVVVRGVARVTREGETYLVRENESTFTPTGARHRPENPGESPLDLVEVQTGDSLGEDDIVRLDDDYGR